VVGFSQSSRHGERHGMRRSDAQENATLDPLVGYHNLCALIALDTLRVLGGVVVTART
jgi:hypothetical protein